MYPQYYPWANYWISQECLNLMRRAVAGETADRMFYDYLISVAPTPKEKEIIAGIRDDELKHFGMFRQIYRAFTGQYPTPLGSEDFERPDSYCDGVQRALFGELNAVELYRQIYFCLPTQRYRDMLFEIITDEIEHAAKYNYLYAKNNCTI